MFQESSDRKKVRHVTFVLLTACLVLLISSDAFVQRTQAITIDCNYCLASGHNYLCTDISKDEKTCFLYGGDVECTSKGCTCCRTVYSHGCRFCEPTDNTVSNDQDISEMFDNDEELFANAQNLETDWPE